MMNCPRCGTFVENDACFCSECGIALAQSAPNACPTPPANTYQAPPQSSYNTAAQKCGVTVVYPDGHSEIGDLYISPAEITFVKKSKAVRLAFGFLGSAIEDGEQSLRLRVCDIVGGCRTRIGLNHNVYQITLNNGATFKICFNMGKNITLLENLLMRR